MFDIGFPELLLVSVVMLLVFGPERLPEVLRNIGRFVGGARRSFDTLRAELEREVGADELKRELHNARIMEEAKQLEKMVRKGQDEVEEMLGSRYAALKEEGAILDRSEESGEGMATAQPDEPEPASATESATGSTPGSASRSGGATATGGEASPTIETEPDAPKAPDAAT
ncbi:MAG: Sec-independent protein translocase protein TatB [Pseudomonadales bacterium]|nr:Sec-independent protein translocase protein TatB [Pseudomonadales bacterium]